MYEGWLWLAAVMIVFYFLIYSFLGWVAEVAYAAFTTGKLVNRGFLNGPICPIYGFGMLALLALMDYVGQNVLLQFLVGMAVTTGIELAGGWALYKIFHTRWWDYSMFRFNLGGYICLRFSLLWGVASLGMVRIVHPLVARGVDGLVGLIPPVAMIVLVGALAAVFLADVALSAAAAVGLNKYLTEIDDLRGKLHVVSDKLTSVIGGNALELDEVLDEKRLQLRLAAMEGRENTAELRAQLTELAQRAASAGQNAGKGARRMVGAGTRRLLRAFPDMRSEKFTEALAAVKRKATGE